MKKKEELFNSPSCRRQSLAGLVEEIKQFINEKPDYLYHLIIGTDSQKRQGKLNMVSAIIIYRENNGGRYFWQKKQHPCSKSLRNKMWQETLISLKLAHKLLPILQKKLNSENYELSIHIDVGNAGPTRVMIKELVAIVNDNGFTAKTKPESYGASSVADRYT